MKKGQSYIIINDLENTNHKLVKLLLNKGYFDFELAYASHWSTNAGWEVLKGQGLPTWLGFTVDEAIREIKKLPNVNYIINGQKFREGVEILMNGKRQLTEEAYNKLVDKSNLEPIKQYKSFGYMWIDGYDSDYPIRTVYREITNPVT